MCWWAMKRFFASAAATPFSSTWSRPTRATSAYLVRGVKTLFGRGSNEEKIGAIAAYCKNPNPDALLIFVADHISIPADARRMEMTDKDRYQKIREDLGPFCGIVELSRVQEGEAVRWI